MRGVHTERIDTTINFGVEVDKSLLAFVADVSTCDERAGSGDGSRSRANEHAE